MRSEICSRDHLRYSSYNEADSDTQHKHVRCDTKVILFVMIAAAPWAEVSNIRYHRSEEEEGVGGGVTGDMGERQQWAGEGGTNTLSFTAQHTTHNAV